LSIFKFLRDIVSVGLENAISLQGGMEYLVNRTNNTTKTMSIKLEITLGELSSGIKKIGDKYIKIVPITFLTDFTLAISDNDLGFIIVEDHLVYKNSIHDYIGVDNMIETAKGLLEFHNIADEITRSFTTTNPINLTLEDIFPPIFESINYDNEINKKHLFIENSYNTFAPNSVNKALQDISIYDLDSLKENTTTQIVGKRTLEDNGENIAIVLNKILKSSEKKRELINYIKYVLPFVEDIDVEKILDKGLHIVLKEKYSEKDYVPSYLLSSGTMTIIALIVALFFENEKFIFLEEPGGKVHPFLIVRLMELIKEASNKTQIFITTHNPEIVKYAGIENVFGMVRDTRGNSFIHKLSMKDEVLKFLENEIGLDELFVQNLLSK
jgi:predicted ATPase